jgi:hypothetical protein
MLQFSNCCSIVNCGFRFFGCRVFVVRWEKILELLSFWEQKEDDAFQPLPRAAL